MTKDRANYVDHRVTCKQCKSERCKESVELLNKALESERNRHETD